MLVIARAHLALFCAAAFAGSALTGDGARAADDKTYMMKITLATVDDTLHQFARNFAAALEKSSAGRIKTEIYPSSKLGSITQQTQSVQFGAIQCQIIPPEFYVGIDERYEVLATPGLVTSLEAGQRLAADPAVLKLMLSLGEDKWLHGVGLFMAGPSSIVARRPIRHLADLKGKKIRIFASQFQSVAMQRLGATPKPMNLADVLPALQDNALDAALGAIFVFNAMHYQSAAKYVTETGQPAIFAIVEVSKKWYNSLPPDLRLVIDKEAAAQSVAINPLAATIIAKGRADWTAGGGELIALPPDEQATLLKILTSVGDEVSNAKPQLTAAYKIVTEAAERSR